ncbi:MAG: hypothetical protein COA58_10785 [Bacteroidetes bacterium]|nr:MAG: hypothetical protein COA58_10785 [Bacteroidota bacterium]
MIKELKLTSRIALFGLVLFGFHCLCMAQTSAVQLTEMNLLYKGMNNPFRVAVDGVKQENIVVRTSKGLRLKQEDGNHYLFVNKHNNREELVYVGKVIKTDTTWLDSFRYRIRYLPNPTAQFGTLLNDGLPKDRIKILAQTEIIATMGQSFSYNLEYQVKAFKMIFAYADKPAIMMSSNSNKFTGQMLREMQKLNNRDRILIEGIRVVSSKHGFKANLSPIILTVRSDKAYSLRQNKELIYAKIRPDELSSDPIYTDNISSETLDTLQNELVDLVYKDEFGFKRLRNWYSNGTIIKKRYFNDDGKQLYALVKKEDGKWQYQERYDDGNIKVTCVVDDSVDYIGNTAILDCDDYISGHCYVGHSQAKECLRIVHQDLESAVHQIKYRYELNPIDEFKEYYPNGKIKTKGVLILGYNSGKDKMPNTDQVISKEYPYHFRLSKDISVMQGVWYFYNEDGTVSHTRLYEKGVRLK